MSSPLKPCRECGHEVSKSAKSCPNCGARNPVKRESFIIRFLKFPAYVLVAITVIGLIMANGIPEQLKDNHAKEWSVKKDTIACTDKEFFEKLKNLAAQKDTGALNLGLLAAIDEGNCMLFSQGEKVFVTNSSVFDALIKIRRKGDIDEFWTNNDATIESHTVGINNATAATNSTVTASSDASTLMSKIDELNDLCRGGSGDDPLTIQACDRREVKLKDLEKLGWCWGNDSQIGSDKAWQKCNN